VRGAIAHAAIGPKPSVIAQYPAESSLVFILAERPYVVPINFRSS